MRTSSRTNASRSAGDRRICDVLAQAIDQQLPGAENKIWHRHPVWFLDGNPIVGYHKLKDCIRLLFWSGQSFDEPGLAPEGGFQTAGARYTAEDQISPKYLKRWLAKSIKIQWDYKNIPSTPRESATLPPGVSAQSGRERRATRRGSQGCLAMFNSR